MSGKGHMTMKKILLLSCAAAAFVLGAPASAQPDDRTLVTKAEALEPGAARQLADVGSKVFGIKWGKIIAVSDRGFDVVTDQTMTLSYRPAGNAWFVQNAAGRAEGAGFRDSDAALASRGRAILAGLRSDPAEIGGIKVLQQYVTAGSVDPATRGVQVEPPRKDRRTLEVTRAIRKIPVWSSRLMLDLGVDGKVAAFEMSWPKISDDVLREAVRLDDLVRRGFKAPERKGGRIEEVKAGILHSPAIAQFNDEVAAIRVIYASTDPRISMKAMIYLDANGRPVTMPRSILSTVHPSGERRATPAK